jgi:mono/diheme cytochrome c family protein
LLILVLAGCGATVAATGSVDTTAVPTLVPAQPTATAIAVPYVPPSAAQTVQALFALTPHPTPTATIVPSPTPFGATVPFAAVEKILVGNCAGCHPPNQGMNLTAGHAYASIVNVRSQEVPSLVRVKPGDPAASYLYQKVSQARPAVGVRMPKDEPPLTPDELTALRAWIEQGARGQ